MLQTERTYQTTRYTQQKRACKRTSISVRKRITRQRIQSIALELVWPTRCAICDAPGVLVCDTCKQALRFWDPWLACATCGAPFGFVQCCECNSYTQEKRTEHTAPLYCSSSVLFNDESGAIIRCYKDAGEQRLAEFIAQALARVLHQEHWKSFGAITFIPASNEALLRRGFDHMERVARILACLVNIPLLCAFERPNARDQRTLSRESRHNNMKNAFVVRKNLRAFSLPERVLVLDDVMTTGTTLACAAEALACAGVKHTEGLTFARVV